MNDVARVVSLPVDLPAGVVYEYAHRIESLLALVALRMPEQTDAAFEQDVGHVAKDLETLRALLLKQAA